MSIALLYVLLLTVGAGLYAFLEALVDGYAILTHTYSRRQRLSHLYNWLSRSLAIGFLVSLLFGFTPVALVMALYAGIVFWLSFEYTINRKLNRAPDAVGQNAWTDKKIRAFAQALTLRPELVKRILFTAALTIATALVLLVTGCHRQPQPTPELVTLPAQLQGLPVGASSSLPDGFFYTRISDSAAVKNTQPVAAKKIKIKNVGNITVGKKAGQQQDVGNTKQKDVGNVAVGKKAFQQQDVGNVKVKDVGNMEQESQAYLWVWLLIFLILIFGIYCGRKFF